jgi:hypothetical protein
LRSPASETAEEAARSPFDRLRVSGFWFPLVVSGFWFPLVVSGFWFPLVVSLSNHEHGA